MSIQLIRQYHTKVAKIIQYSGSHNESTLRKPFQDLLEQYARARSLELIAELDYRTSSGATVYPDGTLKDALRQDWGYWESKDQFDDLEAEIQAKLAKGYPKSNILFEDTRTAVLYQAGQEVARADFKDDQALDTVLARFVSYESREVREFREAIEQFSQEVPALAEDLRAIIAEQAETNPAFQQSAQAFLQLCREAINPAVDMADAREMIIQHVLTQDIFTKIFDAPQFHLENNIAQRLGQVVNTFYHGAMRHQISDRLGHYYATINARAAQIYPGQGQREDNITDWALAQFRERYGGQGPGVGGQAEEKIIPTPDPQTLTPGITKLDIFHYVYAVLHDPAYRQKYELNLKREFPRIPFYPNFWQWAEWGRRLLALHLHYETAPPYPLERLDKDPAGVSQPYKAKLKAIKANHLIELDSLTTLAGIPPPPGSTAWAIAPPWNGSSIVTKKAPPATRRFGPSLTPTAFWITKKA